MNERIHNINGTFEASPMSRDRRADKVGFRGDAESQLASIDREQAPTGPLGISRSPAGRLETLEERLEEEGTLVVDLRA